MRNIAAGRPAARTTRCARGGWATGPPLGPLNHGEHRLPVRARWEHYRDRASSGYCNNRGTRSRTHAAIVGVADFSSQGVSATFVRSTASGPGRSTPRHLTYRHGFQRVARRLAGRAWDIGDDAAGGYGPARLLDPGSARAIATHSTHSIPRRCVPDSSRPRWRPPRSTPDVWTDGAVGYDDFVTPYFAELRRFHRSAAAEGRVVLIALA